MLVDGGTSATGEYIVAHLKKHFGDGVELEHVVLTHSDNDHASGLREVLDLAYFFVISLISFKKVISEPI
ncbi:MAG: MBL fold metallo-hydrolase [Nevskia sp.]|nr:MBL fold metallo-hydrolase [Nevskia sp.]